MKVQAFQVRVLAAEHNGRSSGVFESYWGLVSGEKSHENPTPSLLSGFLAECRVPEVDAQVLVHVGRVDGFAVRVTLPVVVICNTHKAVQGAVVAALRPASLCGPGQFGLAWAGKRDP